MKRVALLFLLLSSATATESGQENRLNISKDVTFKKISVGAVHYPPYYDFSGGDQRPTGFLANHIHKSLSRAGYSINWQRIPLARGDKALNKNIIQVYGSYAPVPGDKAKVEYSQTPLIKMQPIICGLKNSLGDPKRVTEKDVYNKETLYPQGAYIHPKMEELKLKVERLDYSGDYIARAIKMIEKSRSKFFILPESFRVRPYLKNNKNLRCSNFIDIIAMHLSFSPGSPWKKRIAPLIKEYPTKISIEDYKDYRL